MAITTLNATVSTECEESLCDSGLFLPLFGESEVGWHKGLRAVLYLLGLFWSFSGVNIGSDVFMEAIEKVTSKKKRVFSPKLHCFITVKVWNATVANLTLMALGSSAPEILLSVIELLGNNMYAGDLGPSTIVGSAAFNLFVISAVCVSAIPNDEIRAIKQIQVFAITATFSVFAYVWLIIIVQVWTPDVIAIEEGIITFLFFPVLICLAFAADKGYFSRAGEDKPGEGQEKILLEAASQQEIAALRMEVLKKHGTGLPDDKVAELIKEQFGANEEPSRAARRVAATEAMFGGAKKKAAIVEEIVDTVDDKEDTHKRTMTYNIQYNDYSCLESCGNLEITVLREADGSDQLGKGSVAYKTVDGSAKSGDDFIAVSGVLDFAEGETEKIISVAIIDDDALESDEFFSVELSDAKATESSVTAKLGKNSSAQVRIVDDDAIGQLAFTSPEENVAEDVHDKVVKIGIQRQAGSKGKVSCKYRTEDGSAMANLDYEPIEGTLEFEDGQTAAEIEITIKPRGRYENSELFRLILEEAEGGVTFAKETDGGEESCICTIMIESDNAAKERTDKLLKAFNVNWDKQVMARDQWKEQFTGAIFLELEEGTSGMEMVSTYFFHILNMPWALFFACVPPTAYCEGWLCFCSSLVGIGLLTAFIGDLAALAGCCLGIPDSITAITLVALGTSLPDTFASKAAAEQDPTADNSIGNVTGSNSVNVFLGLGLPWTIGAIFWAASGELAPGHEWLTKYEAYPSVVDLYPTGGKFVVIGGSLGFSVIVFCCCAVSCISVFVIRRYTPSIGGELGGPKGPKYLSSVFFVTLWFIYVGMSIWKTLSELTC
mmetsp:Transcript_15436/g.27048  ORF Transcript_15436/g.27048 Transcript_15436/m.27048 type:complete len:833 (-) Transcript_15436:169-2667(-)|eukprot:CAMPEP_0197652768 /NCGR_PEP_ID=MMETSP1338-20131121/34646_1 /TAXON_ID=43686 ORGANISM="Pelagodinium beii, Strain RCC1491" /NCGR_SAMPLE_ID=MMETSP1338 /ASSEMBLY_ACC=CAM_ASM_000754 /LENGTH=832 /DNA_ID=CAMNT_0043227711 /DNA_START=47 /DNA_END=2545 /DNA_ORIENTATION=+